MESLYGSTKTGKTTAEDSMVSSDTGEESTTIDFSTVKDSPETFAKVMADPKKRAAYYSYRDKIGN